jgi:hypothetical protein
MGLLHLLPDFGNLAALHLKQLLLLSQVRSGVEQVPGDGFRVGEERFEFIIE